MANKKSFFGLKLTYDAPATLSFAFICLALFAADFFLLKNQLTLNYLSSPTAAGGKLPFMASNFLSYVRLFTFGFGSHSASLLVSGMIFILLLGPSMEERYGTVVIAVMMIVCLLFSGVLNACFSKNPLTGSSCIVFMMIFLNAFASLSKKKIPVSFLAVFILFIFREIFESSSDADGFIKIIINIAGGLCGSLFAFLTSPKAKSSRKKEADTAPLAEKKSGGLLQRASFFRKKAMEKDEPSSYGDETVVSSMRFDD